MCFYRTKLYKACGHTEFRRFMCIPVPISNNDDQSDLDSNGNVYIKGRFACGQPPEHVNDLELGLCGHCRRRRYPNKGASRRRAVLGQEQSHGRAGAQVLFLDLRTDEPKHGGKGHEHPVISTTLPEAEAREPKYDKTDDVDALPADAIEDWRLLKQSIVEPAEECRHVCEEIEERQPKASFLPNTIGSLSEHRPVSDKIGRPAIVTNEHSTKPNPAKTESTLPQAPRVNPRTLSHSVTKVRRDLNAAKGRVRSMINTLNGKSEVNPVMKSMNHKSMARIVNTISRNSEPDHRAKPEAPIIPKRQELVGRPLPPYPYPDPRTLPKSERLEVLTKHRYHRLVPIPEESTSQALVVANSVPNTIVLRRAKAIKVRNLNAFHCPVRQPRFGLKRKVLSPPVPRHSTPPVAVPCSKFADLGRRRVSEMDWCFVI